MGRYLGEGYCLVAGIKLATEIGRGSVHCKIQQVGIAFTGTHFTDQFGDGCVIAARHTLVELVIHLQIGFIARQLIRYDILDIRLR